MAMDEFHGALNVTTLDRDSIFCVMQKDSGMYSRGIWFGEDPLGKLLSITMAQLSIFYLISYSLYFVLRTVHVPKVVCDAAAGIIMGPTFLGRYKYFAVRFLSPKQFLLINTIATIGLFFNVFVFAVKMDFTMITRMGKNARRTGISCFIAPFVVLLSLVTMLLPMLPDGLPKGSMLIRFIASSSLSAFINLIPVLEESNLLSKDLAQLAMSAAAMCESIVWVLWVSMVVSMQPTIPRCITSAAIIVVLITFAVLAVRPMMVRIVHKTPEGKPVKDSYVVTILLFVLLSGILSNAVGGAALLGPLVLGLVIPAGPPLGSALTERAETIMKTCLLPFFFLSVGGAADLSSITTEWKQLLILQSVLIAGYLAKLLGGMLPSLRSGMSLRWALIVGLMLNTKGVIELQVFRLMILRKSVTQPVFSQLVCSAMTITAIVAPLTKFLYKASVKSDKESQGGHGLTIQSIPSTSEMRILSCVHNEDNVPGVIDLIEASNPTKSSPICLYMVHLTELVGRNAPSLTPHRKHDAKCKHNGCIRIMGAFSNHFPSSRAEVMIQPFSMVAFYRSMHEGICRLAQDKRVPLIIVPFIDRRQSHAEGHTGLSKLNSNIQAYAQCTVGVLVDRATHAYRGHVRFSFHIAVVFIGGQDDREALALAAHMSNHPGVVITLFQIMIRDKNLANRRETEMNRVAIKDFRTKNISNERVTYREIRVDGWDHTIRAVRSLGGNSYDLFMVGRRHSSGMRQEEEEEMGILIENPELGMIGDILVSSDFRGGTVSVLVMQHHNSNVDRSVLDNSIRLEDDRMHSFG